MASGGSYTQHPDGTRVLTARSGHAKPAAKAAKSTRKQVRQNEDTQEGTTGRA